MKTKNYIAPCATHVDFATEAFCIAASAVQGEAEINSGIEPAPWEKGNTNWW